MGLGPIHGCCLLTYNMVSSSYVSVAHYLNPRSQPWQYIQSVITILPMTRSVRPLPHTLPRIHLLQVLPNRRCLPLAQSLTIIASEPPCSRYIAWVSYHLAFAYTQGTLHGDATESCAWPSSGSVYDKTWHAVKSCLIFDCCSRKLTCQIGIQMQSWSDLLLPLLLRWPVAWSTRPFNSGVVQSENRYHSIDQVTCVAVHGLQSGEIVFYILTSWEKLTYSAVQSSSLSFMLILSSHHVISSV